MESANPELRDLLNTAVEIEEKKQKPGLMERRVLRELDRKSLSLDWGKGVRPTALS